MAEIWAVMEFNPIKVVNPNQMGEGLKNIPYIPYIRYPTPKKFPQKISAQKVKKWQRYGLLWNLTLLRLLILPEVGEG